MEVCTTINMHPIKNELNFICPSACMRPSMNSASIYLTRGYVYQSHFQDKTYSNEAKYVVQSAATNPFYMLVTETGQKIVAVNEAQFHSPEERSKVHVFFLINPLLEDDNLSLNISQGSLDPSSIGNNCCCYPLIV